MKSFKPKFTTKEKKVFFACIATLLLFTSKINGQFQYEPNDSFNDAYTINFDLVYNAAIFETGDVDFYELFVPNGAVLEFNGFQLPSNLEMRATIYNCPSELCSLTTLNLVDNATRYYKVCSSGTYYFKIFDADNNESSQTLYSFGITIDSTDICEFNGCNDVITNACPIATSQPIQAAINSFGDADYYQFDVPVESVININVQTIDDDISMTTVLYDAPNELSDLETWTSNFSGNEVNRYWKVCSPGTYYLKLFDQGDNNRSSQLYNLEVTLDSMDTCEFNGCNDVITNACQIPTNQTIQAAINSFEDADYYQFDVPVESIININVQNVDSDIRMTTVLYDAPNENSVLETWNSNNSGNDVNRFWKVCTPGIYYLKLFDQGNNNRSSQLYSMMVSIDSSDIYECNDTEGTPYEIQVCSDTLLAAINLEGDQDYFSFTAPANINISIEVTNVPDNIDMEVELITPNSGTEPIASGNNGSSVSGNFLTTEGGTYILHIFDDGNNELSPDLFEIRINLIPEFNLDPEFEDICIDDLPFQFSGGSPIGGYYSGEGVDSITGIFNPAEAGVGIHSISFTFVDTSIACTTSISEEITVHDLPTGSFNSTVDTVFLSDSPFIIEGGMPPLNGIFTGVGVDSISGEFDPSIAGIGTHEITYTITDNFGCSSLFIDSITVIQMTSVVSLSPNISIIVSPNPFSEKINIQVKNLSETEIEIDIFNLNGTLVYGSRPKSIEDNFEINLEGYPSGIYLIRFEIEGKFYSTKIIKE